ncbi:c-type cytochrome [Algoriphagus sp. AGSA1]|uniref:c-type cytochrome n=1 Tax=Algoriphagus sp. AGSA1 TaxID=2907213 RepID=UPI001F184C67|nr:c-type cytochrome [Algoriphagus sp. AGSA1]MCE7056790.1 c-type cytochrome [Algoriphagus sp. AGSA1]
MKIKILLKSATIILAVLLFACGSEEKNAEKSVEKETTVSPPPTVVTPPAETEPAQDSAETEVKEEAVDGQASKKLTGEEKMANSDCLSCHMMDRLVIGPAFLDIAAEYANNEENVNMLANKVIKGGAGVWGETAMPPHASLSEEDAKDMVRYILSL